MFFATQTVHSMWCAMELEKVRTERNGCLKQTSQQQASLQRKAVKGAADISHTTNYSSLVDAMQFMGCNSFKHLRQGENVKYKSQRIINEFVQVLASQIERKQLQDLLSATFYSIVIGETKDVSILNEMIVYAVFYAPKARK